MRSTRYVPVFKRNFKPTPREIALLRRRARYWFRKGIAHWNDHMLDDAEDAWASCNQHSRVQRPDLHTLFS